MNTAGVEKQRYEIPASEGDPRYLVADDGYIYMTQYGGRVTKLDANTLKVVATFTGGITWKVLQNVTASCTWLIHI